MNVSTVGTLDAGYGTGNREPGTGIRDPGSGVRSELMSRRASNSHQGRIPVGGLPMAAVLSS